MGKSRQRRGRRILPKSARLSVALGLTLLVAACMRPADRPREGADPGKPSISSPAAVEIPPTLAPAAAQAPSPPTAIASPSATARPAGSPGAIPVISGIQPAPNASVPAGPVTIAARVAASAPLVDVTITLNGEPLRAESGPVQGANLNWQVVRTLATGTYEVRVQARDETGALGGYRWQFTVAANPTPTVAGPAPIVKPAAPKPVPAPSPKPASR
jgi:hypothetical protein